MTAILCACALPAQRDKDAAMRISALIFAMLALLSCSKPGFHMTDISGAMPRLDFNMTAGGKPVSGQDYRGKVVALYFGYTHCPDVCPTTLANLADMAGKVHSPDLRILFVTVDPDRDTDSVLTDYAKAFSSQVVGLRGSANELADLARRYRVAYTVTKGPPYEVMHSNAVFFFDRDGRARLVTTDTTDTAAMAKDVTRLLRQQ
jgi:protein SCO1/2